MAEEETDVLFSFLVNKQKDGSVTVKVAETGPSLSPEDIYSACNSVVRQIDAQMTAQTTAQVMLQTAAHAQNNGNNRTEGGIVLPS